jgi:hypothetical protein
MTYNMPGGKICERAAPKTYTKAAFNRRFMTLHGVRGSLIVTVVCSLVQAFTALRLAGLLLLTLRCAPAPRSTLGPLARFAEEQIVVADACGHAAEMCRALPQSSR